jgi:hypothetical protein
LYRNYFSSSTRDNDQRTQPSLEASILSVGLVPPCFAVEEAVEEDDQLAGLQAPLEDQIAVSEEGGVPAQAIPPELPERLATSLQGDQAFIGK